MANPILPTEMRAWAFSSRGPVTQVIKLSSLPTPLPSSLRSNEVLICVSHVSFNTGFTILFPLLPHFYSTPMVPECEFCGTVVTFGPGSDGVSVLQGQQIGVGDEVVGFLDPLTMWRYNGALAEYVVVKREFMVRKPENMSSAKASGLAGCGWTAVSAGDAARLKKGDKVLVNGASGSVGSMLVQVAKRSVGESGKVVAVCSGRNAGLVMGLGADEVIDYTVHSPLHSYLLEHHSQEPFNTIYDVVGNRDLHTHCPAYLTQNGLYDLLGDLKVVGNPSWWSILLWMVQAKLEGVRPVLLGGVPRQYRMHNAFPSQEKIQRVVKMAEEGKLNVLVDSVWKMEDAIKAYERTTSLRARGKVIVEAQKGGESTVTAIN